MIRVKDKDRVAVIASKTGYHSLVELLTVKGVAGPPIFRLSLKNR